MAKNDIIKNVDEVEKGGIVLRPEFDNALKDLNNQKASRIDRTLVEFLRRTGDKTSDSYSILGVKFNYQLINKLPTDFKKRIVVINS